MKFWVSFYRSDGHFYRRYFDTCGECFEYFCLCALRGRDHLRAGVFELE